MSAADQWHEKLEQELKATGGDRMKAVSSLARKYPELTQAYEDEHNAEHRQARRR